MLTFSRLPLDRLAPAILADAAEFWTGDQSFRRWPELNVVLFPAV
jgi:hypothetical protein